MLVGEASGEMEAREQTPFVEYAQAGHVLTRNLRRMGYDREQFIITNLLRCRPKNNWIEDAPWEFSALAHCRPNLDSVILERRPKCIVALGTLPMRELSGMAGSKLGISHLAGYVLPLHKFLPGEHSGLSSGVAWNKSDPIPVIGDFHPSYLRRGSMSHVGIWTRIIQRAVNIAAGKDRKWMWDVDPDDSRTWEGLHYLTKPSTDEARAFQNYVLRNPGLIVAEDLETFESTSLDEDAKEGFVDTEIRQVQFCVRDHAGVPWAIALPWEEPFRTMAIAVMLSPNVKYGHNWWLFDHKVLRACAAREGWEYRPQGVVHDTLQMFHHWQPDLPAHLQFACNFIQFPFPWKHLADSNIEFYGCVDVHSDLELGEMLERTLKRDGLWDDESYFAATKGIA
jgi:uracil-DNA glycosylase family 4